MPTIVVIGAGPMGLMAAYELGKKGYSVHLYERDDRIGGMSASFDFAGTRIERFYHFICATDYPTFQLLDELGIHDALQWRTTQMGFYYHGKLYPWGNPLALLRFPHLSLIEKIRYAVQVMVTKNIKDWRALDKEYAHVWLKRWLGEHAYQLLWKPLFALKFDQYQENLSAAWLGTRIKRVALSRKNLFEEQLGYLIGGSATLLDRLEQAILKMNGAIHLRATVERIITEHQHVTGILVNGAIQPCDAVISTVPLPYVLNMAQDLSVELQEKIRAIKHVGVACVLLKLRESLTNNFWLNINDPRIDIPGVIEYSQLQKYDDHILYAPYYMSKTHFKYQWRDQQLIDEVKSYLPLLNPQFRTENILAAHVARYSFAQTVCDKNFYTQIPPMQTNINGFYMADTAYYYPEDRSIAESVAVGKKLAALCNNA